MKIYTRTGDDGSTGLCAGPRVAKDHPRIEACGTLDELNAALGVVRAEPLPEDVDQLLHRIQHELFAVGADLAMPGAVAAELSSVDDRHIARLEEAIDHFQDQLPPLGEFILPGGTRAAAATHLARTICRRAERRVVALGEKSGTSDTIIPAVQYLNRLGDLLFVLPRLLNQRARVTDEAWRKDAL